MSEVTVTCEQLSDGTWVGTADEDDIKAALEDAEVEAEVEEGGYGVTEAWGQTDCDIEEEVTGCSGRAEVTFYLNFEGYEFADDEEREAAEEQVWASLTLPIVSDLRTAGETDVEYSVIWCPVSVPGPAVDYEVEMG